MIKPSKPAQNDESIDYRRDLVLRDLERLHGTSVDLFKWIVTSCLALNGAALLALFGATELRDVVMDGPVWLFIMGLLLSLFGGIATMIGFAHHTKELFAALWRGDSLDIDDYEKFAPKSQHHIFGDFGGYLLGFSAGCFILGCGWVATVSHSLPTQEATKDVSK